MSAETWSLQIGDPRLFALRFALVSSPADDSVVSTAARATWGSLQLWVDGVNLCAHDEEGEQLQSAHWYLLPVVEWFIHNWQPIFHEQRLPVAERPDAAAAASLALAQLETAPERAPLLWGFPASSGEERLERLQRWMARHRLLSGAPEAPLPPVWLRRSGEALEVSMSDDDEEDLFDGHLRWTASPRAGRVPVEVASRTVNRALRGLLEELSMRSPAEQVARDLLVALDHATAAERADERLAWLVGLEGSTAGVAALRQELDELTATENVRTSDVDAVMVATPVATLFGSLSPVVEHDDVQTMVSCLRQATPAPSLLRELDRLAAAYHADDYRVLPPGEAGGELGDGLSQELSESNGQLEIVRFLQDLGVTIARKSLSDARLRAVTLLHDDGRAVIVVNSSYEWGVDPHVVRFTLAHELAHLLYDRSRARVLALASGPWTPPSVERRANGFAAGLLMPERLLRAAVAAEPGWPHDPAVLHRIAGRLGVGVTALAQRLPNAGLLTKGASQSLLEAATSSRAGR